MAYPASGPNKKMHTLTLYPATGTVMLRTSPLSHVGSPVPGLDHKVQTLTLSAATVVKRGPDHWGSWPLLSSGPSQKIQTLTLTPAAVTMLRTSPLNCLAFSVIKSRSKSTNAHLISCSCGNVGNLTTELHGLPCPAQVKKYKFSNYLLPLGLCWGPDDSTAWPLLPRLKSTKLSPGLWIRIRIGSGFSDFVDPDPGARKLRNISVKMHFLVIFKKILPL
jgi:hypothetical protein